MQSTLLATLKAADQSRTAVGHFNVSDSVVLQAVALAARESGLPVIAGLSEGERKFFGTREAAAMVNAIRDSHGQPVFVMRHRRRTVVCFRQSFRKLFRMARIQSPGSGKYVLRRICAASRPPPRTE